MFNRNRILAFIVFADFVALTIWAMHSMSWDLAAMWAAATSSPIGIQIAIDLVVALCMVMGWMWKDAKLRGMNPIPFVVATLVAGSIAPLFYLVVRRPLESERLDGETTGLASAAAG